MRVREKFDVADFERNTEAPWRQKWTTSGSQKSQDNEFSTTASRNVCSPGGLFILAW